MTMIPQLIYLALTLIGLGMEIAKHGDPKTSKYNAWTTFIASLITCIILYFGGFWDPLID